MPHPVCILAIGLLTSLWGPADADPASCSTKTCGTASLKEDDGLVFPTIDNHNENLQPSQDEESSTSPENLPCSLWYGSYEFYPRMIGLFAGLDIDGPHQPIVDERDLVVTLVGMNRNVKSAWQNKVWSLNDDIDEFHFGVANMATCAKDPKVYNAYIRIETGEPNVDTHDANRSSFAILSARKIEAGEEILLDCRNNVIETEREKSINMLERNEKKRSPLEWLRKSTKCVDNVIVKASHIPDAGNGAFTRRSVKQGGVVSISPVIVMDRSQFQVVHQHFDEKRNATYYGDAKEGQKQVLTKYAIRHPRSDMLMVPYGIGVAAINCGYNEVEPNVRISWSKNHVDTTPGPTPLAPYKILRSQHSLQLNIEYVATKDINAREEIIVDCSAAWRDAWEAHQTESRITSTSANRTNFWHEIYVPDDELLFPKTWMRGHIPDLIEELRLPPLKPNQIEGIPWKEIQSGDEILTKHAHIMGLRPSLRMKMLEYASKLGITEIFRDLTYRNNPIPSEENRVVELGGLKWLIQRPPIFWSSDLHWISPNDGATMNDFLVALGDAGFDEVLRHIAEKLGFDGVAAYHLSFIAVSHSAGGYMHYDTRNTDGKAFNFIFPLLLPGEGSAGLDVRSDRDIANATKRSRRPQYRVARLPYEYDVACMMGDLAYHATSSSNYQANREMRMAATIYVADINESNIDSILSEYTQHYPPKDDPSILRSMAGAHWKRGDSSVRLPSSLD